VTTTVIEELNYLERSRIAIAADLDKLSHRIRSLEITLGAMALLIEADDGASPVLKRCAGVIRKGLPRRQRRLARSHTG
jgi:hypothetical protein